MNKTQLINEVAGIGGMSKKDAALAVDVTIEAIVKALQSGDKVQIAGFGTFEVKHRNERCGRNPKTGEAVTIPATKYPAFTASKSLKNTLK